MGGTRRAFYRAKALGIRIFVIRGAPLEYASDGRSVAYGWHQDANVRADRIWDGIAERQIIATGGVPSEKSVRALAKKLRGPLRNKVA